MLSGCGISLDGIGLGGGIEDYCNAVEDVMSSSEADSPPVISHGEARDMIEDAADVAPDEIADEWHLLLDATTAITDAMAESGLTDDQMQELMAGRMPDDLSEEDMAAASETMSAALADFDIQEVNEASIAIADHAAEKCDVEMPTD